MPDLLIPDYLRAAAALMRLPLDDGQLARVAVHLQRTLAMAALLEGAGLQPHDEMAEVYCPAAFPESDPT